MKSGINKIIAVGIISLFPFLHSCAQTKKIKSEQKNPQTSVNQIDAKGLNQGYWIEPLDIQIL